MNTLASGMSYLDLQFQGKPRVIATGGLAHILAGSSKFIEVIDETLTLDGLRLVYERNNI